MRIFDRRSREARARRARFRVCVAVHVCGRSRRVVVLKRALRREIVRSVQSVGACGVSGAQAVTSTGGTGGTGVMGGTQTVFSTVTLSVEGSSALETQTEKETRTTSRGTSDDGGVATVVTWTSTTTTLQVTV